MRRERAGPAWTRLPVGHGRFGREERRSLRRCKDLGGLRSDRLARPGRADFPAPVAAIVSAALVERSAGRSSGNRDQPPSPHPLAANRGCGPKRDGARAARHGPRRRSDVKLHLGFRKLGRRLRAVAARAKVIRARRSSCCPPPAPAAASPTSISARQERRSAARRRRAAGARAARVGTFRPLVQHVGLRLGDAAVVASAQAAIPAITALVVRIVSLPCWPRANAPYVAGEFLQILLGPVFS
jgi:hypothetical protein